MDGLERINGVIFGSLFLTVFEFELDPVIILLSKLIHFKGRRSFFLLEKKRRTKTKNTIGVDMRLEN